MASSPPSSPIQNPSTETTLEDGSLLQSQTLDSPRLQLHSESTPGRSNLQLRKSLTYTNCLALILGLQIGSGIFAAPAVVSSHVPSPIIGILVWAIAGCLVWTGAVCFIELGTSIPVNGGIQEYLRHCYGDVYGFLFAWIYITMIKPCSMAMISLVFSEYFYRAISPDVELSIWALKGTALLGIYAITGLNYVGTHVGTRAASVFMVAKVFGLGSVIVLGLAFRMIRVGDGELVDDSGQSQAMTPLSFQDLSEAAFAALYAYGGWESVSFVAGEVKDASRILPRALNNSMKIIISLFVFVNISFYSVLSMKQLQDTNAVALSFGRATLGRIGAIFFAWIVCVACLGSLHSTVFAIGRLTQSAGVRQYLPLFLDAGASKKGWSGTNDPASSAPHDNIPSNAMLLNAGISTIYVLIGSFRGLLVFKGMTEYLIYLVTVLGIWVIRHRSLHTSEGAADSYHASNIHIVAFCAMSAFMITCSALANWVSILAVATFFVGGALVYRTQWWNRAVGRKPVP